MEPGNVLRNSHLGCHALAHGLDAAAVSLPKAMSIPKFKAFLQAMGILTKRPVCWRLLAGIFGFGLQKKDTWEMNGHDSLVT